MSGSPPETNGSVLDREAQDMSATCEVIARGAKLYVFPNCELQAGVRMTCPPIRVLEQNSDVDVIGRAVMDALQMFPHECSISR